MDLFNCPNCGAQIANDICPYCGTAFLDLSLLEVYKDDICVSIKPAFWIKIKVDGKYYLIKAKDIDFGIEYNSSNDSQIIYMNNHPMHSLKNPTLDLHLDLSAKPFKVQGQKDVLMHEVDNTVVNLYDVGNILKDIKET